MGKHFERNEIGWYRPFKLKKRVKELESLVAEQFNIINSYKDDVTEKTHIIEHQSNIIASLKEDLKVLKENTTVAPDEATPKKTKTTKKTTKKETESKKEPAKRGRKKKEEK